MNKNLGIGILIVCFGSSSVNLALADQMVQGSPIVVQPYEVQQLNQEMINRDRQNRDEEIEIQNLVEENNKLTQDSLARQNDEGLAKINQTMLNYRNALFSRDQARIMANSEQWGKSRYGDLIALTEDADAMTENRSALENKSGLLAEKYQMLTALKDEMTSLNERLRGQGDALSRRDAIIADYREVAQQQQDKIQMLVAKLGDMDQKISHYDEIIAEKDQQIAELRNDLAAAQSQAAQTKVQGPEYDDLQAQILSLKTRIQEQIDDLRSKNEMLKAQADQIDILQRQPQAVPADNENIELSPIVVNTYSNREQAAPRVVTKVVTKTVTNTVTRVVKVPVEISLEHNRAYLRIQAQVMDLREKMHQQALELKDRDASIRWLNQVLAAAKNKAEYYRLTSQRDRLSIEQVQRQVRDLKADFARNLQDYNQFESTIVSLKAQASQLNIQVSQKQEQVDLLKSELEDRIAQRDDRLKLAHQLVSLQEEEAALLQEKSDLSLKTFTLLDRHISAFENRIKVLLANHQIHDAELKNRVAELRAEFEQQERQQQVLNMELREKIAQERNQGMLEYMIHDLRGQLQEKDDRMASLRSEIQSNQDAQAQADTLKQQLADQQNKVDLLKQELDSKTAQSDQMTVMMSDYQKKLESKDSAYNQQLQQVLLSKNGQAQMEAQIADLSARLQKKEAQVIKIEKAMYDLQESAAITDRDAQAKDLNLSMIQQKAMDDKVSGYQQKMSDLQATNDKQAGEIKDLRTQLALVRQELKGTPSSDEINYLRTGLSQATLQLKHKDDMLAQIKVDADGYEKQFQAQTEEFQNLKTQLQSAYDQLHQRDEDLKSKDLEVVRLKESVAIKGGGDSAEVMDLKAQLKQKDAMVVQAKANADEYEKEFKEQSKQFQSLKDQLQNAYDEIDRKKEDLKYKDMAIVRLKDQLAGKKIESVAPAPEPVIVRVKESRDVPDDRLREKLKQALDEVDAQGHVINLLVQKLHEAGENVDLSKDFSNQ